MIVHDCALVNHGILQIAAKSCNSTAIKFALSNVHKYKKLPKCMTDIFSFNFLMRMSKKCHLYVYYDEFLPVHEPPLLSKNPFLQPHVNDPTLLKQNTSHPPLLFKHSLISKHRREVTQATENKMILFSPEHVR